MKFDIKFKHIYFNYIYMLELNTVDKQFSQYGNH